jgi:hypothetical protein
MDDDDRHDGRCELGLRFHDQARLVARTPVIGSLVATFESPVAVGYRR